MGLSAEPSGKEGGLQLRATQLDRQASVESDRRDGQATPVLGGGRAGALADGPRGGSEAQQEEEKKGEDEEAEEAEEEPEDLEANRPQEFKFCFFIKMQLRVDKNSEIHKEILNSN